MKQRLRQLLNTWGFDLVRLKDPAMADEQFEALSRQVEPFTMTSKQRLLALYSATRYVIRSGVPGAIVECGVWRGGSSMIAALAMLHEERDLRPLYLFDTFEGMPPPTSDDVRSDGKHAQELLDAADRGDPSSVWAVAGPDEVRANLRATGYPDEKTKLVIGRVEETIPAAAPDEIALLRLDTDWYSSTRHEMEHLFPRLQRGGVLIVDDYGHWSGARRAVDEFLERTGEHLFLVSLDETGVCATRAL